MSEVNSRLFRREAIKGNLLRTGPAGDAVKGRFYQGDAGEFKHITANADGSVTIGKKAFADDVVAFVSGAIHSHPTIDDRTKEHLRAFVRDMDDRAVANHGYKGSPEEAAVNFHE